jgi:hypothetical protein
LSIFRALFISDIVFSPLIAFAASLEIAFTLMTEPQSYAGS